MPLISRIESARESVRLSWLSASPSRAQQITFAHDEHGLASPPWALLHSTMSAAPAAMWEIFSGTSAVRREAVSHDAKVLYRCDVEVMQHIRSVVGRAP